MNLTDEKNFGPSLDESDMLMSEMLLLLFFGKEAEIGCTDDPRGMLLQNLSIG